MSMKILFAADMSFNYFDGFPGSEKASLAMAEAAELFRKADYSILNLENIFGNKEKGEPILKSGPNLISEDCFWEYIYALDPDIVGLANNHTKDYGEEPMFHTIRMLSDRGYTCIGAGRNLKEAYQPAKVSKDGVQAAVIAVCENEFGGATVSRSGTAGYRLGMVSAAIRKAREEGYWPIIYFHGGNEKNPFPSPGKVELYRHFIDMGAEAVIAMHTHCPQGYEFYQDKPIVYSMGNFFFPTYKQQVKSWFYGYMSELELTEDGVGLEIHPYKFDFDQLTVLKGEEKNKFFEYMRCLCEPISNPGELQNLFDSWCLTQGYAEILTRYKAELFADGHACEVKGLKNLFCCEAHNELMKNTFEMLFESRVEEARPGMERIYRLQNMEYL